MSRSVAFKTLGCRLNQYESDALAAEFTNGGYTVTDFESPADVYVINTCTVTSQSDQKSRQAINKASRSGKDPLVVVTGCMARHHRDTLEAQSFVTYVVENEQKSNIFPLVEAHYHKEILHPVHQTTDMFGYRAVDKSSRTRSFIKIQDGCDNLCTFCIIPFVRGLAASRPMNDILDNVRAVLAAGYKELVITGVNIGRYEHAEQGLDTLLARIVALPGDFRVRISSIEPDGFTDAFFNILEHEKVMPHLHLCLQSGSERVLRRMRRMYTADQFLRMVERIRGRMPLFNLSTDIMVGFPGETDEDFESTRNVCRDVGFSHIHTFKYSARTGTRAERMESQVPDALKKHRSAEVRALAESLKTAYMDRWNGRPEKVLIERIRDGRATGYGEHYLPVEFDAEGVRRNEIIPVTITGVSSSGADALLAKREKIVLLSPAAG